MSIILMTTLFYKALMLQARKNLMLITLRACYTNDITSVLWKRIESIDRTVEILQGVDLTKKQLRS